MTPAMARITMTTHGIAPCGAGTARFFALAGLNLAINAMVASRLGFTGETSWREHDMVNPLGLIRRKAGDHENSSPITDGSGLQCDASVCATSAGDQDRHRDGQRGAGRGARKGGGGMVGDPSQGWRSDALLWAGLPIGLEPGVVRSAHALVRGQ